MNHNSSDSRMPNFSNSSGITLNLGCSMILLHLSNTFSVAVTNCPFVANCYNCKYCKGDLKKMMVLLQANAEVHSVLVLSSNAEMLS